MSISLFESYQLGDLTLANRMVMAPMTRNRSNRQGLVTEMMVTYYQQRATAGLIIAESSPVSAQAIGYPNTPGLFTKEQVESWRSLTSGIHERGGYIFAQLQHCGRISHSSMQPNHALPIAPSAIKADGKAITYSGAHDFEIPHALGAKEIPLIVEQFRYAAEMAKYAGFDGVEVHGANGYLIDQFLRDATNHRTDYYGGNINNRMRLLNEILESVCSVWPENRVGLRLTPENSFNSMSDSNPQKHFEYIIEQLNQRSLSYVHLLEGDMLTQSSKVNYSVLRKKYKGAYIANNGYDYAKATHAIAKNDASLVAFGIPFLANPDLVNRYRNNYPLNLVDQSTFYGGDEKGYTDYSSYCEEKLMV